MENIIKKLEYIQEKDFIDEIQNALDNETDINNCIIFYICYIWRLRFF